MGLYAQDGINTDPTYDKCLLAFIDILGWKQIIQLTEENNNENSLKSQLYWLSVILGMLGSSRTEYLKQQVGIPLTDFEGMVLAPPEVQKKYNIELLERIQCKFTQFSDNVVMSAPIASNFAIEEFLLHLRTILNDMLFRFGVLIRGAIVVGNIIHEDHVIFGPALIQAYELESQKAIYPRILVTKEAKNVLDEASVEHGLVFCEDAENNIYISFARTNPLSNSPKEHRLSYFQPALNKINKDVEVIRNKIMIENDADEKQKLKKIEEKYDWIIQHLMQDITERD